MTEQQIIDATCKVLRDVTRIFGITLTIPEIRFHRKGRWNGLAACNGSYVSFNLTVAENFPDPFINTIIHEVAHLATFKLRPYAKQAHGPEFRAICTALGGSGTTKAEYGVSKIVGAKVETREDKIASGKWTLYKCSCNNAIAVTKITHNKIVRNNAKYSCNKCKTRITIVV